MARRRNKNSKPHLLSEATVKKFMKLSGLEPLSQDFRSGMGYKDNSPERHWEQPGLSKYRSGLLREQDEEEMGAELPPEEEDAGAEAPAEGGDVEAKVEEIVTAIADAIEQTVPEVSVDVAPGGEEAAADAAPEEEAPMDDMAAEEPPADEEAALREVISKAIREAMVQKEELEGNVSEDPSTLIGSGEQSELKEEEEAGGEDPPEVEAVVDAIVDAIAATTDIEVDADTNGDDEGDEAEPVEEEYFRAREKVDRADRKKASWMQEADDPAADGPSGGEAMKYEARALKAMNEALRDRKTARRLVERVLARAKRASAKPKATTRKRTRKSTRRRK